jgi:hypothetical protein
MAMHARRFACFILGLWLGGGILMAWVAMENRRMADRLVAQALPEASLELKALGPKTQTLLRYHAAEANRSLARKWGAAQLILGGGFFLLMLFGSREDQFLLGGIVLLVALAALEYFIVTPAISSQGRVLDFIPADQGSAGRSQLWVLETARLGIEAAKWVLTLALAARMVLSRKRSGRSRDARRELDMVNKANYRSVNW